MVAYEDKPRMVTENEKQDYSLASAVKLQHDISDKYEPDGNRFSASNEGIDRTLQMPANNEYYQQASEKYGLSQPGRISPENDYSDYLSQPIWFYKIMERIEKDRKKEGKQPVQKKLYLFQN